VEKAVYERLMSACQKYRSCIYNEKDFQQTIRSITEYITEYELFDFRETLNRIEGFADYEISVEMSWEVII